MMCLIVGEQLPVFSPKSCQNGGDKHKIVDSCRSMAVSAEISLCHPPQSPILVSTAVGPRLQKVSETKIAAKI